MNNVHCGILMLAHTGTDISKLCRSVQKVVPGARCQVPGVTQEGAVTACDQGCDCCMLLIPVNISSQIATARVCSFMESSICREQSRVPKS